MNPLPGSKLSALDYAGEQAQGTLHPQTTPHSASTINPKILQFHLTCACRHEETESGRVDSLYMSA